MDWLIDKELRLHNGAFHTFLSYGRVATSNIEAYLLKQFPRSTRQYVELLRLSEDECEAILPLCPNCGQIAHTCPCSRLTRYENDFIRYFSLRVL